MAKKDRDKPWAAVTYERCAGMNSKDGKCTKTKGATRHISHKKSWGKWYGMLSWEHPKDLGYGKNGPQKRLGDHPTKGKDGIWRW